MMDDLATRLHGHPLAPPPSCPVGDEGLLFVDGDICHLCDNGIGDRARSDCAFVGCEQRIAKHSCDDDS